jgi:uncharacterized CHY-type Zn-finger protein
MMRSPITGLRSGQKSEWNQKAILCGVCGTELSIDPYMNCEFLCPACRKRFNPGCRNHYRFYFGVQQSAKTL